MENAGKGMILLGIIAYILLPDFGPGPIDDIIMLLCGLAAQKKLMN